MYIKYESSLFPAHCITAEFLDVTEVTDRLTVRRRSIILFRHKINKLLIAP